jgi:hypothetical protein
MESVTCTKGTVGATGGAEYNIVINDFAVFPMQNNHHYHNGNPSASLWSCSIAGVTAGNATCTITKTAEGDKEYDVCSHKGICDFSTGQCRCFDGYQGPNCDNIGTIVAIPDNDVYSTITASGDGFTGTVLRLETKKSYKKDFKFLEAMSNDVLLLDVRGDGLIQLYFAGLLIHTGGATIKSHGLMIESGGQTISAGGLNVVDDGAQLATTKDSVAMHAKATSASFSSTIAKLESSRFLSPDFKFLEFVANGVNLAEIYGDGKAKFYNDTESFSATSAATTFAGGMGIAKSLYVGNYLTVKGETDSASSLTGSIVAAGGLGVAKKAHIGTGLDVDDGGARLLNTNNDQHGVLVYSKTAHISDKSVLKVKTDKRPFYDYNLFEAEAEGTQIFDIRGDGVTTVHQGGLKILSGGETISSGGLYIVASGETIAAGGLHIITGGERIDEGGLLVSDGGATIESLAAGSSVNKIKAKSSAFSGSVVELNGNSGENFHFINARADEQSSSVFEVLKNGDTIVSSATESTGSTSGALISKGGLAVAKRAYIGGALVVEDATQSVSSTTGAVIIAGGLSVAKDCYIGGRLFVQEGPDGATHQIIGNTEVQTMGELAADAPMFTIQRSRGSAAARTAVEFNDEIGRINFKGYDGTSYVTGASIRTVVQQSTATITGNTMGSKLIFETTALNENIVTARGEFTPDGVFSVYGSQQNAESPTSGSMKTLGGLGVAKAIYAGDIIVTSNDTEATTATSGSLITAGGLGVAKAIYAGGALSVLDTTASTTSETGAIVTAGGLGVAGSSNFGSSVTVDGNTAGGGALLVKSTVAQTGGSLMTVTGAAGQIALQVSAGSTKLAERLTVDTGGVLVSAGQVDIATDTEATTATSGSLITAGGLGVAKAIYAGGALSVLDTTASTTSETGAIVTAGGLGVAMAIYTGGALSVLDTTASTTSETGAIVTAGGLGVAGSSNFGSSVTVDGNAAGGGALLVKSTVAQTGGSLMTVTGAAGQIALQVSLGKTSLNGQLTVSSGGIVNGNNGISSTGSLSDVTTFTATGVISTSSTAASTSDSTGSIITGGGIGVGGDIYAGGSVVAQGTTLTSDKRFKRNITSMDVKDTINKLLLLRPVNYRWRSSEFPKRNFPTTLQPGFIAQELAEHLPELVKRDGNGHLSVDYSRLTAYLVSGFQYLDNELQKKQTTVVPTSSTSNCEAGATSHDETYFYVCISANRWKRSLLEGW